MVVVMVVVVVKVMIVVMVMVAMVVVVCKVDRDDGMILVVLIGSVLIAIIKMVVSGYNGLIHVSSCGNTYAGYESSPEECLVHC